MPLGLKLGKFGAREKGGVILLTVVMVGVLGYRQLLKPTAERLRRAHSDAAKLESELAKLEAQRPNVEERRKQTDELKTQLSGLYGELERLEEGLLNREDQDVLLQQVVEKHKRLQVAINAVKPLKEPPKRIQEREKNEPQFYKRLFVQLDTYAPFDDLIAYIKTLDGQSPYQRVRGVIVKIEGQEVVRPRALILVETLLAETPQQKVERHKEVFGALDQLAARQAKDPFLAHEKPKEEQEAVGLELSGIFGEEPSLTALINGDPYQMGDSIQGKRIVTIDRDHVVLEQGSRRFLLRAQRGGE